MRIVRPLWAQFQWFVPRAKMLDEFFGGEITSWYRDSGHNDRVGGSPFSQHLVGLAFDWAGDDPSNFILAAQQLGMVALDEGDHVHVQMYPAGIVPIHRFM